LDGRIDPLDHGRRGIWAHRFYRVRSSKAGPLYNDVGTFQIVKGTVIAAANVRGRVYVNFGDDWILLINPC